MAQTEAQKMLALERLQDRREVQNHLAARFRSQAVRALPPVWDPGSGSYKRIDPVTGKKVDLTEEDIAAMARKVSSGSAEARDIPKNPSKIKATRVERLGSGEAIVIGFTADGLPFQRILKVGPGCPDPYREAATIASQLHKAGGFGVYGHRRSAYRVDYYESTDNNGKRFYRNTLAICEDIPGPPGVGISYGERGQDGLALINGANHMPVRPAEMQEISACWDASQAIQLRRLHPKQSPQKERLDALAIAESFRAKTKAGKDAADRRYVDAGIYVEPSGIEFTIVWHGRPETEINGVSPAIDENGQPILTPVVERSLVETNPIPNTHYQEGKDPQPIRDSWAAWLAKRKMAKPIPPQVRMRQQMERYGCDRTTVWVEPPSFKPQNGESAEDCMLRAIRQTAASLALETRCGESWYDEDSGNGHNGSANVWRVEFEFGELPNGKPRKHIVTRSYALRHMAEEKEKESHTSDRWAEEWEIHDQEVTELFMQAKATNAWDGQDRAHNKLLNKLEKEQTARARMGANQFPDKRKKSPICQGDGKDPAKKDPGWGFQKQRKTDRAYERTNADGSKTWVGPTRQGKAQNDKHGQTWDRMQRAQNKAIG